jgi:hypothetical protein
MENLVKPSSKLSIAEIQIQILKRQEILKAMPGDDAAAYKKPIEEDIAKLEVLKVEKTYKETDENELIKMAIYLHSNFCHHNHTDACGWEYEFNAKGHDWTGYSHKHYLQEAAKHLPHFKNIILGGKK